MGDFNKLAATNYKLLAGIPTIDAGYLVGTGSVLIKLSQTDVVHSKKRSFISTRSVVAPTKSSPTFQVYSSPFPFDMSNASIFSPSPSGKLLALVRVDEAKKDEPFIEVYVPLAQDYMSNAGSMRLCDLSSHQNICCK